MWKFCRVDGPVCWTKATVRYRASMAHNGPSFIWPARGGFVGHCRPVEERLAQEECLEATIMENAAQTQVTTFTSYGLYAARLRQLRPVRPFKKSPSREFEHSTKREPTDRSGMA